MHVADHEDGSHCGVQDPDQDCEEETDVGDLCSSTGAAAAGTPKGRSPKYTIALPGSEREMPRFT
jgi:hypothetical protein